MEKIKKGVRKERRRKAIEREKKAWKSVRGKRIEEERGKEESMK